MFHPVVHVERDSLEIEKNFKKANVDKILSKLTPPPKRLSKSGSRLEVLERVVGRRSARLNNVVVPFS